MVALWSALGQGPAWLRWPMLAAFGFAAGFAWADFHVYFLHWWWSGGPPPWFSFAHLEVWYWQWIFDGSLSSSPAGMLAATLLIFRVLGYRLCRDRLLSASMQRTAATAVIIWLPVQFAATENISGILAVCGIFWSGFLAILRCIHGASDESPLLAIVPQRSDCQPQFNCGS